MANGTNLLLSQGVTAKNHYGGFVGESGFFVFLLKGEKLMCAEAGKLIPLWRNIKH